MYFFHFWPIFSLLKFVKFLAYLLGTSPQYILPKKVFSSDVSVYAFPKILGLGKEGMILKNWIESPTFLLYMKRLFRVPGPHVLELALTKAWKKSTCPANYCMRTLYAALVHRRNFRYPAYRYRKKFCCCCCYQIAQVSGIRKNKFINF